VQTLRKKITLSSSERSRRVEVGRAMCLALDLGWLLVTEEDRKGRRSTRERLPTFHQATSGVTGGGGELIAAREKEGDR